METSKKQKVDRHEMPCQPADVRRRNFKEVALGYDEATALAEAGRCLQCKKPLCVSGCPVNVPIRDFIGALRNGDVNEAYRLLKTANALPAVCGRVCPQEKQCESKCIVGTGRTPTTSKLALSLARRSLSRSGTKPLWPWLPSSVETSSS